MAGAHAYILMAGAMAALVPGTGRSQPAGNELQPMAVDAAELVEFARTWQAVSAVRDHWRPRVESAADEGVRNRTRAEANAEMRGIVEASPLTVRRYNQLVVALQGDTEFRRGVEEVLGSP